MQNKGLIRLFAILFGLVSLYQLSFTYFTGTVEEKAQAYAQSKGDITDVREQAALEQKYLDSVANKEVLDLLVAKFTYNDIKDKEMNLGLDLKGGINAVLQVSVKEVLIALSNESKSVAFNQALEAADERLKESNANYLDLFFEEFERISNGSIKLSDPAIFGNRSLSEKINFNMSNEEVKPILQEEIDVSINTAFEVLRSRIDKFGVTQPNIQRIGTSGRIQIELPGAKDIERVTNLITSKAELQFWSVYANSEMQPFFIQAESKVAELLKDETDAVEQEKDSTDVNEIDDILNEEQDSIKAAQQKTLFTYLKFPTYPISGNLRSSTVARAKVTDTARVNELLNRKDVRALLPSEQRHVKFLWDYKPFVGDDEEEYLSLYAIKGNRKDVAPIQGDVITDAAQVFDERNNPEVSMAMNAYGSTEWAKLTAENVGNFVAVVLDDYVYTAPSVSFSITGGRTSISGGSMTVEEAQDIATVLKAGKLPAEARMIESAIVGPSLGQESIDRSINSFLLAIALVLVWMIVYYGRAGLYADVALVVNILFIFGILASFNAVLTLPGIAGIILTIGMSVDANVIIFERIKEGLNKKKGLKQSVDEGFSIKGALSAIIDANITSLLTGIILYVFGTGPIKGFALTLMIGIATSLFTAIFITRLLIDGATSKGKNLTFNTSLSKGWFQNINIEFLRKRKIAYIISGLIIAGGIASIATVGLKQGVDFKGGRTYTVRFDQAMNATEVAETLKGAFGTAPEVKTYGADNQLKITTVYKIEETTQEVDEEVQQTLYNGLQPYLGGTSYEDFKPGFEKKEGQNGIMSSRKVEPTIADDIKTSAIYAVFGSLLVVFLYILLRFRKVSFSLGAVIAVFHDVLIVLGIFSIFYAVMPFDMEIGQSFIAAILTVVGYSLNDTVVIFDRIREFAGIHTKWAYSEVVDKALSSTLGRTINTSLTTLLVMLAIFLFGGDSIRGFMFALIIGVAVGTYSSLFVATPIMYDTSKKKETKKN